MSRYGCPRPASRAPAKALELALLALALAALLDDTAAAAAKKDVLADTVSYDK